MGSPIIWNVGGARPGSRAAVSLGPVVVCFGGGLTMFVILLINDAREFFLPSLLSNILFPGSRAARSASWWSAGYSLFLHFVGGESTPSMSLLLHLFAVGQLWQQNTFIEVALNLSNILDKGLMSHLNLTWHSSSSLSWS